MIDLEYVKKIIMELERELHFNIGKKPIAPEIIQFQNLTFSRVQKIQQHPNESSENLHERLRPFVLNSFVLVDVPMKINTHSWYTFDATKILGEDTVVVSTSTCKHETPYKLFVGKRKLSNFMRQKEDGKWEYILYPLWRDLTEDEKNKIYDNM